MYAHRCLHLGVNATVSIYLTDLYGFGPRELGIFYISGILGTLVGWFVVSCNWTPDQSRGTMFC